jgi:hypothetical protein
VNYASGKVTDEVRDVLDVDDERWERIDDRVELLANADHRQSLLVDRDCLLAVVLVENVADGEAWAHVFGYDNADDLECGIETQRVAEHARGEDPSEA